MKRVSIIALALALLLCGCGSASPPTPEAAAAASPEIVEDEPEVYDSSRDFLGLSNKMDGLYHIWIPGEQFLLRFNIHIWSEE